MKKHLTTLLPHALFLLLPLSFLAQTARLQVIHNAADPAAASVDVWLTAYGVTGATPLIDNFTFHSATPYIDAPAGVPLQIGVAPGTSTSAADTIANFNVQLTPGETYEVLANGVLNTGNFDVNPDGRSAGFGLLVNAMAREDATNANEVDFFVVYGATDAPTVDIRVQGTTTPVVDNAAYGDITGYLSLPGAAYPLEVTTADGSTVVETYYVDLTGLNGGSAVVFASGFLAPGTNQNGPAFGVCFALADGTTGCFNTLVAIDEPQIAANLSIAPNPAQDFAQLNLELLQNSPVTVSVMDISGRELMKMDYTAMGTGNHAFQLPIQQLANGVYAVNVTAGEQRTTTRLAVSR